MTTEAFEVVTSDRVRPREVAKKRPAGPRYVARKPMVIGEKKIKIGDLVPEASKWPRVEAWVRSGYIDIVEG
jgi:hypothetical protein